MRIRIPDIFCFLETLLAFLLEHARALVYYPPERNQQHLELVEISKTILFIPLEILIYVGTYLILFTTMN